MIHKDLKNHYYVKWLKFLKSTEKWDSKRINEYQFLELKRIINLAYHKTEGYKKLFEKNKIEPAQIKGINDIHKLPFTNKELIRNNLNEFSNLCDDYEYITTGGSTGIPFGFYRDKNSFSKELASKAYQYYRVGWKEGAKQLVLRGLPINTKNHMIFVPEFNELRCSSYFLRPAEMDVFVKEAKKFKPDFIKCYPSSGYLFAKYLKNSKQSIPPLKAVLCASENLYEHQKKLMEEVYNCRIFSHYGHYELAVLAAYCEYNDNYHVLPFYGYAELVDKKGNIVNKIGKVGEIVATSFLMEKTLFIRYKTGDLAVYEGKGCPECGRPYQIWSKVKGRMQEMVVTGDDRLISMTSINMHDNIFDDLAQFQFYQKNKGEIQFRYISKYLISKKRLEDIKNRLEYKFGKEMSVVMKKVKRILPTKRGKHRFLIQKLNTRNIYEN